MKGNEQLKALFVYGMTLICILNNQRARCGRSVLWRATLHASSGTQPTVRCGDVTSG